jgi:UDP-glucose 6-dehydrogenase
MKRKVVSVICIGRVGLPLALVLADNVYKVFGIGRAQTKIDILLKGTMPFVEEGGDLLKKYVSKSFFPTINYENVKNSYNAYLWIKKYPYKTFHLPGNSTITSISIS